MPEAKRGRITRKVRAAVWQRYDGRCGYCGHPVALRSENYMERMCVDHVVPVFAGGVTELDNLMPACHPCNYAKGSMDLERFRYARLIKREASVFFTRDQLEWLADRIGLHQVMELERERGPFMFWYEVQERA